MGRNKGGKKPLYRKDNTVARGHVRSGGEYRWSRHAKSETPFTLGSMRAARTNGYDYTPLFRFLLSKVGDDWSAVHSEAVSRLDREEPIWWLVARTEGERRGLVRVGENTYWSGLYVDGEGRLAIVDPDLRPESLRPSAPGLTFTFNGLPLGKPYVFGEPSGLVENARPQSGSTEP